MQINLSSTYPTKKLANFGLPPNIPQKYGLFIKILIISIYYSFGESHPILLNKHIATAFLGIKHLLQSASKAFLISSIYF